MLLSIPKGFQMEEVSDKIYEKFPDILNIHEVSPFFRINNLALEVILFLLQASLMESLK